MWQPGLKFRVERATAPVCRATRPAALFTPSSKMASPQDQARSRILAKSLWSAQNNQLIFLLPLANVSPSFMN
jgi:hypothetical protein